MQPMTGTTIQTTAPPPTDDTGTTIQTARARTQGGTVHDIGLDVTIGGQQE